MSAQTDQYLDAAWATFKDQLGPRVSQGFLDEPHLEPMLANAFKQGVVVGILNADAELFDLFQTEV